ncbi:MAG TPA: EcsC family protein [Spirochaetota bacterium]|nr:EcsC family protein [Spirochaetota bacterium]HPV41158.1 EcsC family protein [Spirochaetota bacterium]
MSLTPYEQRALKEIEDWETAKPGMVIKTMDAIGKPVTVILERIPRHLRGTVERAVMGFMEMLKDISYWTYSDKSIIKKGRKHGLHVASVSHLSEQELEKLDRLARKHFAPAKIIAALEGAGCGMGGLALIAADIPVLMGIIFRSIQQIGTCYGFSMQDPLMLPVVMGIYHAGTSDSSPVKSAVLADMQIAAAAMAGKSAYVKIAAKTKTAMAIRFMEHSASSLPSRIAENISKRKLGQLIPVVGAVIGAGFNYWLMSSTLTAAYMIFRKMHLERKLAADRERPAGNSAIAAVKRGLRLLRVR